MKSNLYFKTIVFIISILAITILIELFGANPKGIFISIVENFFELLSCLFLIKHLKKVKCPRFTEFSFLLAFFFLFLADFSYMLLFYILKLHNNRIWPIAILIQGSYFLAFSLLAVGIKHSLNKKTNLLLGKVPLFSLVFVIPLAIKLVAIPFIQSISNYSFDLQMLLESLCLIASVILLHLSTIVFLSSRGVFWSLFTAGIISLILGDWSMRSEEYQHITSVFGFYEFFWGYSIVIMSECIIQLSAYRSEIEKLKSNSLLNTYKIGTMGVIIVIIGLTVISKENSLESIKIILVGTSLGLFMATIVGQYLIDQLNKCSHAILNILSADFTKDVEIDLSELPIELQADFNVLCRDKIEGLFKTIELQNQVCITEALNKTARQTSHNIRAPLAILKSLLMREEINNLPEEVRTILRNQILHIQNIANDLLVKNKIMAVGIPAKNLAPELLIACIEEMVSEKKLYYKAGTEQNPNLNIVVINNHPDGHGLFANINLMEMKCILSNLIDNSVEALPYGNGQVVITVDQANKDSILITDIS